MAISTTDPRTGKVLATFDELTDDQLEDRLARAAAAADSYRLTTHEQRAGWLRSAADVLDKRTDEVAELMTLEMGKTRKASAAEIGKCSAVLRYYADNAAGFLADEPVDADSVNASQAYAHYLPIGVVLAIMPWNFPLWQAMRFAAPALAAGNVGLLKHASNVPQTALFMEELFRDAGFPDDVFQTLLVGSSKVERILRDDRVAAATLTGSEGAGVAVATHGRRGAQEGGPGARRLGRLRRHAVGRPACGGQGGDHLPHPEQRPVLHLGQAVHRAHRRLRRVRGALPRRARRPRGRRPDGGGHRRRSAGHRAGPRGRRGAGQGRRRQGRDRARRRRAPGPGGLVVPADPAGRRHRGHGDVPRGGVRPGGLGVPGPGPRRRRPHRERHPLRPGLERLDPGQDRAGGLHPRPRRPVRPSSTG